MEGRALFFSAFISVEYTLLSFYYTLEDVKCRFWNNKKNRASPGIVFWVTDFRIIYRQAMRPHLIKLNLIWYFVLSLFTSSTIQTNHVHHLHSTLSTDDLLMYDHKVVRTDLIIRWSWLTLWSYIIMWSRLSSCQTGQREWSAPHKGLSAVLRLRVICV